MKAAQALSEALPSLPLTALAGLEQELSALMRAEPLRQLRGEDPIGRWMKLLDGPLQRDLRAALAPRFAGQRDVIAQLLTGALAGALLFAHPEWAAALRGQSGAMIRTLELGWADSGQGLSSFMARPVLTLPLAPALIMSGLDSSEWTGHVEAGLAVLGLSSALAVAAGIALPPHWDESLHVARLLQPDLDTSLSWSLLLPLAAHLGTQGPAALRVWSRSPLPIGREAWTQVMAGIKPGDLCPQTRARGQADPRELQRACWPALSEQDIPVVTQRAELCAQESALADDLRQPWEVPAPLWPRSVTCAGTGVSAATPQTRAQSAQWRADMLNAAHEGLLLGRHLSRHAESWSKLLSLMAGRAHPEQLVLGLLWALPQDHNQLPLNIQQLATGQSALEHQVFLWRTNPQVHEALWLASHLLSPDHTGAQPATLPARSWLRGLPPVTTVSDPADLLAPFAASLRFMRQELNEWGIDLQAPRVLLSRH